MELQIYNAQNSKLAKPGERSVRIGRKSGLIAFSRQATEEFNMKDGTRIVFGCDKKEPGNWYFGFVEDESGFNLRVKDGAASFNCTALTHKILDSLKLESAAGFLLAKNPETNDGKEYYALITSKPLNPK